MLEVWLVRHGQTAANAARRFAGLEDTPLTDAGRAMGDALDAALADVAFDAVWSSPLQRARHTVEPIAARRGCTVHVDAGLQEYDCGEWSGLTRAQVAADFAAAHARFASDPSVHAPPGGETAEQVAARVTATFARLRAAHPTGRVLVASHKGTLRVLLCTWFGIPLRDYRRRVDWSLCGLTRVAWTDDGPQLRSHNALGHLPPELRVLAEDR